MGNATFVMFAEFGSMLEYYMTMYPWAVVGIGIGFLILLGLAANARTARLYEGQDITGRYGSSVQPPMQQKVVVHHPAPSRRYVNQPYVFYDEPQPVSQPRFQPAERVIHIYDDPEPVDCEREYG